MPPPPVVLVTDAEPGLRVNGSESEHITQVLPRAAASISFRAAFIARQCISEHQAARGRHEGATGLLKGHRGRGHVGQPGGGSLTGPPSLKVDSRIISPLSYHSVRFVPKRAFIGTIFESLRPDIAELWNTTQYSPIH
jgi:hypothetical protein